MSGFVNTPGAGTQWAVCARAQRKGGDWAADVMSADARERRVGTGAAEGGSRAHSAPRGVGRGSVREKTARPRGAKAEHLGKARGKDSAQRIGIPGGLGGCAGTDGPGRQRPPSGEPFQQTGRSQASGIRGWGAGVRGCGDDCPEPWE